MNTYKIDGAKIKDFASFIKEINTNFISTLQGDPVWSGNLDAFNDYLSWPRMKYQFVFENSKAIEKALSYEATILWLKDKLKTAHSSNHDHINEEIKLAEKNQGHTMYDIILEIFSDNQERVTLIQK